MPQASASARARPLWLSHSCFPCSPGQRKSSAVPVGGPCPLRAGEHMRHQEGPEYATSLCRRVDAVCARHGRGTELHSPAVGVLQRGREGGAGATPRTCVQESGRNAISTSIPHRQRRETGPGQLDVPSVAWRVQGGSRWVRASEARTHPIGARPGEACAAGSEHPELLLRLS